MSEASSPPIEVKVSKPANSANMNEVLNKVREDQVRNSLSMIEQGPYSDFYAFAYSGVPAEIKDGKVLRDATGSIEGLHGNYHVYIGGFPSAASDQNTTGHMSRVSVAAFDSAFWIHHCQIDRLYAIWQASNGEKHWFKETEPNNQYLKNFGMAPFRKGSRVADPKKQEF